MAPPRIETITLGAARIHAVEEAILEQPAERFFRGATAAELEALGLRGATIDLGFHPVVIELDRTLVVVDPGVGPQTDGTSRLLTAFDALGLAPTDVSHVVLTHAHTDHLAGVRGPGDSPSFPEAIHHLMRDEWKFWEERCAAGDESVHAEDFRRNALALRGLYQLHAGECEPSTGIRLLPAPGHTPGHAAVEIVSAGSTLLLAGDAFHHPLHLENATWHYEGDHDPRQTATTRRALLRRAAVSHAQIAAFHFAAGGLEALRDRPGYRPR